MPDLPRELWIVIIVVAALIALYILYLVASNRRFHRMCDPQIEKLRQYEEARHRSNHGPAQPVTSYTEEDIPPMPDPQEYMASQAQEADYSWDDKKK